MFSYVNRQTVEWVLVYEFLYHNKAVSEKVHLKL